MRTTSTEVPASRQRRRTFHLWQSRWQKCNPAVRLALVSALHTGFVKSERGPALILQSASPSCLHCSLPPPGAAGDQRPSHACAPPAVRRLRPDHGRVPASIADADYAGDVPHPARRVCASRPARGARFRCRHWRGMDTQCPHDASLLSTLERRTEPDVVKELTA
jgi:hypothetical protein